MSSQANSCVAAVISPQPGVAESFLASLAGEGARNAKINLNGIADVLVEMPPVEPLDALVERVKSADFTILLLRYVDEETLEVARAWMRALPPSAQGTVHLSIARQAGEAEFKMSCPKCGQKLMIKDALAFRRTQCPRCKHPFTIPGQTDLVRQEFLVSPNHKISNADLGDQVSCATVLANAYRQSGGRRVDEKSQTMRLDELLLDQDEGSNL